MDGQHSPATLAGETDGELSNLQQALQALIGRAKILLSELETYHSRWRALRRETNELALFRSNVNSELNMLERLLDRGDTAQTRQAMRSSNMPFMETVWDAAKRSRNVTALQKRIYTNGSCKAYSQGMRRVNANGTQERPRPATRKEDRERCVLVDSVTDDGRIWLKISLVTNSRLLFDLAKQGWEKGDSEIEDSEEEVRPPKDEDRDVPLLKTAKDLTRAASTFRVRTKAPEVHMILPRIKPGETPQVDAILDACRATGTKLFLGHDLPPPPPIEQAIKNMAMDPFDSFSDVLNIDCTILLALASDFSHAKVSDEPWFHRALRRQVEIEDSEKLLPNLLYPAMGSHKLVCTREAVKRMKEIVNVIGTPSERARTVILISGDRSKSQSELVAEMQEWSAYEVPETWQLPIGVVDKDENDCQSRLPTEALQVCEKMTDINRSVFLYGWATGSTTITSNRTVVKQLENDLEQHEDLDDSVWPPIWLCPTARSLVGKEKRSDKKGTRKEGAWPLPDLLRREHQRGNDLEVLTMREGREVDDRRPEGYDDGDLIAAKEEVEKVR